MIRHFTRKILYALLVLAGVVCIVFFLFQGFGDPARLVLGQTGDSATIQNIRRELYLDQPKWKQFLYYVNDISPVSVHSGQEIRQKHLKGWFIGSEKISLAIKLPYLRHSYQTKREVLYVLMEALPGTVLLAMAAMLFGVLIIVWDSFGTGNIAGDAAGFASSFLIATAITITRASGKDMGVASLVGVSLPLVIAVAMVAGTGYRIDAPWWIVFNGAVIMPVAFFCLATGPKYLSGAEVAMFYLLETVLAPIWVWMIFAEVPTRNSLIGGAILITALVAHSLWQLMESRKRRATVAVRHPA